MKLNILHKANAIGDSILNYFKDKWEKVICFEFEMDGAAYLDITAEQGRKSYKYSVNGPRPLMLSVNNEAIEGILSLNGITANLSQGELINRSYDVLILDRSILSIRQIIYAKTTAHKKYIDESQVPKIADLAKRTMYLLGLDYAMITINVNGQRKIKVCGVDSSPPIRDTDMDLLFQKFEVIRLQFENGAFEENEVKMGADPEFMISNAKNSKMVPASEFFPREGLVGCDNIRIPSRQQRPVAELRPKPDFTPEGLHSNIKKALEHANKLVPYRNIKWLAGSQPFSGYSIGGHIHFSNLVLCNQVLRALDNYLALPVFLIENQVTAVRRRHKYGQLGDYRPKEYGGFEYRTPGSWLVSPEITLAVLCLAKIVSSNFAKLNNNYFVSLEAHRAFYNGDRQHFQQHFEEIWHDIRKLDMYEDYKEELQILYDMIKANNCWDEKTDIRKAWSLSIQFNKSYNTPKPAAKATVANNNNNNNNNNNRSTGVRRTSRSATNPNHIISAGLNSNHNASQVMHYNN